jgi:hypothetical protein
MRILIRTSHRFDCCPNAIAAGSDAAGAVGSKRAYPARLSGGGHDYPHGTVFTRSLCHYGGRVRVVVVPAGQDERDNQDGEHERP